MKFPKKIKTYCPKCKKHTEHTVSQTKTGIKRSSLKKGSIERAKKRGLGIGYGNKGKYGSKPAISKFKMTGVKSGKKLSLKLKCNSCGKSHIKSGSRVKKLELV